MENLNAEQVKKALECYSEKPLISECEKGCVYYEKYNGFSACCLPIEEVIIKNALALITSQEQRIKELTEENERLHKNFGDLVYVEDIDQIAKEMLESERSEECIT